MNPANVETPLPAMPPDAGWSRKKILVVIVAACVLHLAGIFLLGAKHPPATASLKNVPALQLAARNDDFLKLTDPTLFALPHPEDFPAGILGATPTVQSPEFYWTEAPPFLTNDAEELGTAFTAFMQQARADNTELKFKPEPQLALPANNLEPARARNSSWQLAGDLADRRILNDFSVPALQVNDVIAPSRVQLVVAPEGEVVSAVLLDDNNYAATDRYAPADQQALALARTLRFAPAPKLALGEIIFTWHTVPVATP
jgi:hypothetical protein